MLTKIDPNGTHLTAANMDEAFSLLSDEVQIIFLDIEMPGISGLEAAELLQKRYKKLNVVFVTGHPEYSFPAHSVHPSGFLAKPVDEQDILREITHLRYPIEEPKSQIRVRCSPFAVFAGNKLFAFKSDRTVELFAYLVYRNGAFCTNGELLGVLWEGDTDRNGRRHIVVCRNRNYNRIAKCKAENSIGYSPIAVFRYYGLFSLGTNTDLIEIEGDTAQIAEKYNWF